MEVELLFGEGGEAAVLTERVEVEEVRHPLVFADRFVVALRVEEHRLSRAVLPRRGAEGEVNGVADLELL